MRSDRYKYIRRYDRRISPRLVQHRRGLTKDDYLDNGFSERAPAAEQLYDTYFDPTEVNNLVHDTGYTFILRTCAIASIAGCATPMIHCCEDRRQRRPGTFANDPDGPSPRGPLFPANSAQSTEN